MPLVNGKPLSPDEAILLGLCPECGAPITPKTAAGHARSHWNADVIGPLSEARRRYNLLMEFAESGGRIGEKELPRSPSPTVKSPESSLDTNRPFWIDPIVASVLFTQGVNLLFSKEHFLGLPAWMFGVALSAVGVAWLGYHRTERRAMGTARRVPNAWALAIVVVAMTMTIYDFYDRHYSAQYQTAMSRSPETPTSQVRFVKARHLSKQTAEDLQDALAPYGSVQHPEQRGSATLVRCQTLESSVLLREIYDCFYNIHWNVSEIAGANEPGPGKFENDGAVRIQGTFPDDLSKAFKTVLSDSGIKGHVRQTDKSGLPNVGIDIDCNEERSEDENSNCFGSLATFSDS